LAVFGVTSTGHRQGGTPKSDAKSLEIPRFAHGELSSATLEAKHLEVKIPECTRTRNRRLID